MSTTCYLKTAGEYERAERLDKALYTLFIASRDPGRRMINHLIEGNVQRIINKASRMASSLIKGLHPTPLFEQVNNPNNYWNDLRHMSERLRPIISLTSISGRSKQVEQTVKSILDQSVKPHSVNLYVSDEPYLIDKGIPANSDDLKRMADLGVNVYQVKNIGPYRKQIPLIVQLRASSAHRRTPIITIDDDVIYPPDILERLMARLEKDEAVVAHRGREISFEDKYLASYMSFPPPSDNSNHLNIGTGKNGIAYRLGYFPTMPEDFVGPVLAPTADDIWCKWVTAIYCLPTVILEPTAAYDTSLDFKETAPLDKNGLFHKYNAKGTNDEALASLELYFSSRSVGVVSLFWEGDHG